MHPDKSPGPDGLNPTFYQHFWIDLGEELFNSACCWLNAGILPSQLNDTNIVLAPKGDRPETIIDLRPFHFVMFSTKSFLKSLPIVFVL